MTTAVVVMVMTPMVPMTVLAASRLAVAGLGSDAPEAVAPPCAFLALLRAVLCPPAASALGKLSSVLLPLAALPIGALSDATARLVFPAEVAHDHASPILHVVLLWGCWRVVVVVAGRGFGGELLDEREDIVWLLARLLHKLIVPFVVQLFFGGPTMRRRAVVGVKQVQVLSNLQPRHQVRLLKVCPEVAIFGHVGEQLQRHQNVLVSRHGG